ncbi:MAG: hypothetical protein CVT60_00125 [Actinobacteria bacterium HGW-Actinobacteria-10]|jgi:hypothetical protein|nr:MAG: hypothetical protein CVT60_00125 [Actinobacteria bacterium HGW-Actinobacteria-10]
MSHDSHEDFRAGLDILSPFFEAEGFELVVYPPFAQDESTYLSAQFVWSGRAVTLVHRSGLESVVYSIGQMLVEHTAYLEALGVRPDSAFPPAHDADPAAGYTALLSDLESRLRPFFDEPDREFFEIAAVHGERGLTSIPGARP